MPLYKLKLFAACLIRTPDTPPQQLLPEVYQNT